MIDRICPGCNKPVSDDDTILHETGPNLYWHLTCHDKEQRRRLMGPTAMNAPDPAAWAKASAAAGAKPVEFDCLYCRTGVPHAPSESCRPRATPGIATIDYCLTPQYFKLTVPVEALANLTPDAHTRMLALLNDWISRHKPLVFTAPKPNPK